MDQKSQSYKSHNFRALVIHAEAPENNLHKEIKNGKKMALAELFTDAPEWRWAERNRSKQGWSDWKDQAVRRQKAPSCLGSFLEPLRVEGT